MRLPINEIGNLRRKIATWISSRNAEAFWWHRSQREGITDGKANQETAMGTTMRHMRGRAKVAETGIAGP